MEFLTVPENTYYFDPICVIFCGVEMQSNLIKLTVYFDSEFMIKLNVIVAINVKNLENNQY